MCLVAGAALIVELTRVLQLLLNVSLHCPYTLLLLTPDISGATYLARVTNTGYIRSLGTLPLSKIKLHRSIKGYCIILDIKVLPFTMFLFQFVKHIIETVIEISEILLI